MLIFQEAKEGSISLQREKWQRESREDRQIIVKLLLTKCAEALSEKKIGDFVDSVYSY
jgi:hypothetical protein